MSSVGVVINDWEVFASGFERMTTVANVAGRPSGVAVGPDGALYIGDDAGGRIWKVTYPSE
jgi:glucose/arabinose dehydrogenase